MQLFCNGILLATMVRNSLLITAFLLSCTGLPSSGAEPGQWPLELTIRQFKIHGDFKFDASHELSAELNGLSHDVESLLQLPSERETVHIVLFETQAAYARYMRNYFPKLPVRRAIFIQDRGPGMLFTHWHNEVRTDLRHEVTHALLNENAAPLPLWLDEGLAEYFEVAAGDRFDASPYLKPVAERARQGYVPSLLELESIGELSEFGNEHYRDSWSWLHFLLHRSAATRALLIDYLHRCRSGEKQLELSRQLARQLPDMSTEYQQHFAALTLEQHQLGLQNSVTLATGQSASQ